MADLCTCKWVLDMASVLLTLVIHSCLGKIAPRSATSHVPQEQACHTLPEVWGSRFGVQLLASLGSFFELHAGIAKQCMLPCSTGTCHASVQTLARPWPAMSWTTAPRGAVPAWSSRHPGWPCNAAQVCLGCGCATVRRLSHAAVSSDRCMAGSAVWRF